MTRGWEIFQLTIIPQARSLTKKSRLVGMPYGLPIRSQHKSRGNKEFAGIHGRGRLEMECFPVGDQKIQNRRKIGNYSFLCTKKRSPYAIRISNPLYEGSRQQKTTQT